MRVRREALDRITMHARRDSPRECCGILVGVEDEILEAVPARNIAADPLRRYEVSPADHFAQIKRCRESSSGAGPVLRIVGVYHSHPRGAARPSPTDLDQAFDEYLYVIAGPVDDSLPYEIRGFLLRERVFEEVQLTPTPTARAD